MTPKKNFFNRFFILVAIVDFAVVFGLLLFLRQETVLNRLNSSPSQPETISASRSSPVESSDPFVTSGPGAEEVLLRPIIDGRDPVLGPEDAKVTIVEFSDFSCAFCAEQDKMIKEIVKKYNGQVRLVWKDFPDTGSVSYQASLAARCAQENGKFWEAQDLFFSVGEEIFSTPLPRIANRLGIDPDDFQSCFIGQRFASDIERNLKEASALRLPGVPFFFINDQEYLGAINKEDLERAVEKGLYEQQN